MPSSKKLNIPARVVAHQDFPDRESFEAALDEAISEQGKVDYLILAGFMRILTPGFVAKYPSDSQRFVC